MLLGIGMNQPFHDAIVNVNLRGSIEMPKDFREAAS